MRSEPDRWFPRSFTTTISISLQRYHVECSSPKLLLFTLIEFISSTSYNCILHNEPVSMEEYMPYMHAALRQICKVYITETPV